VGDRVKQTGADGFVLRKSFDEDNNILNVNALSSFIPAKYDEIDITYIVGGNGDGQIGTVTWLLDSVVLATIVLTYNSDDNLSNVEKTI